MYNMHNWSTYYNTAWLKLLISVMRSKKAHLKLTKRNTPTVSTLFSLCWSHVSNWFVLLTRIPDFYRSWQMKNEVYASFTMYKVKTDGYWPSSFLNLINSIFLNVEKEQGQYPVFLMKQEVSLAWRLKRKWGGD